MIIVDSKYDPITTLQLMRMPSLVSLIAMTRSMLCYFTQPTDASSRSRRAQYRFGRTLGAGTYGIVREAEMNGERFAIKIILKKNVKGNEKMVYDEMVLLQRMKHKNIVRFHDWFESKVCLKGSRHSLSM